MCRRVQLNDLCVVALPTVLDLVLVRRVLALLGLVGGIGVGQLLDPGGKDVSADRVFPLAGVQGSSGQVMRPGTGAVSQGACGRVY